MNLEQNKAIVRGYLNEIVNNRNMAAFDQYLSERVVFNEARGFREQHPARIQATLAAFPDFHLVIRDQIAEGDKVVTRVTFHGTHQGQFNGIAATGRQVTWSGMAMDRIADGKVVEMWHVQSTAGLLQQIGAAAQRRRVNSRDSLGKRQHFCTTARWRASGTSGASSGRVIRA